MAGICSRCRIGMAPTGHSLCSVCVRRGPVTSGQSEKPAKVKTHRDTVDVTHGVCDTCCATLRLKPNGHLPRHTDPKTSRTCAGSGNYYTPSKAETTPPETGETKRMRKGRSVWAMPSGHPGSGRRR